MHNTVSTGRVTWHTPHGLALNPFYLEISVMSITK